MEWYWLIHDGTESVEVGWLVLGVTGLVDGGTGLYLVVLDH